MPAGLFLIALHFGADSVDENRLLFDHVVLYPVVLLHACSYLFQICSTDRPPLYELVI